MPLRTQRPGFNAPASLPALRPLFHAAGLSSESDTAPAGEQGHLLRKAALAGRAVASAMLVATAWQAAPAVTGPLSGGMSRSATRACWPSENPEPGAWTARTGATLDRLCSLELTWSPPALAAGLVEDRAQSFSEFLALLRQDAAAQGVSSRVWDQVMEGLQEPERKVVKEDNTQLQTRVSSKEYLDRVVDAYRYARPPTRAEARETLTPHRLCRAGLASIKRGRQMMAEHEGLLRRVSGAAASPALAWHAFARVRRLTLVVLCREVWRACGGAGGHLGCRDGLRFLLRHPERATRAGHPSLQHGVRHKSCCTRTRIRTNPNSVLQQRQLLLQTDLLRAVLLLVAVGSPEKEAARRAFFRRECITSMLMLQRCVHRWGGPAVFRGWGADA
eukprot:scaffold4059_cov393-Prasinococcus_capsulatus_cf.AAC.4